MKQRILFVPSGGMNALNNLEGTKTILRCQKALELWKTKNYDILVASGGKYCKKEIQTIPAGQIMKNWLVSNGVSEDKVICENESLDTYTNIHNSMDILQEQNIEIENMTVVSHWTHILRIRIIFYRNYSLKVLAAPVEYGLSAKEWAHEIIWFLYHLIDKTGNLFPERMARKIVQNRAKKTILF